MYAARLLRGGASLLTGAIGASVAFGAVGGVGSGVERPRSGVRPRASASAPSLSFLAALPGSLLGFIVPAPVRCEVRVFLHIVWQQAPRMRHRAAWLSLPAFLTLDDAHSILQGSGSAAASLPAASFSPTIASPVEASSAAAAPATPIPQHDIYDSPAATRQHDEEEDSYRDGSGS